MSNLNLWNSVFKTDPSKVKSITGKDYAGSSPNPYWIVQRATETFGQCGIGWGVEVISERFERLSPEYVLHVAHVGVWYDYDEKRGRIEQFGQTKAAYMTGKGTMKYDEDAAKKSVTDGMVKCLTYLGFAGDIFSGRWDDCKYVDELKSEFEEKNKPKEKTPEEKEENRLAQRTAEYVDACNKHEKTIAAVSSALVNYEAALSCNDVDSAQDFLSMAAEAWYTMAPQDELQNEQLSVWRAHTKGGCFTTKQQQIIKSSEFRKAYFGEDK